MREDPARLPLVRDAFGRATTGLRSEAAAVSLSDAAAELERRLGAPARAPVVRSGWVAAVPGSIPTPHAVPGLTLRELRERRVAFVDGHLPASSRREYVRAAFEAFLSKDCSSFLGGTVVEACRAVGLGPLRWAALGAGLSGLSGDGTEPGLVEAYLAVDPSLTTRVLDEVSYGSPDVSCDACLVLRSWLGRAPTRWQVRAALEPPLAP